MENNKFKFRTPWYLGDKFAGFQYWEFEHGQVKLIGDYWEPWISKEDVLTAKPDEQCSGFSDKNGNLIYDGDIVASLCPRYLAEHNKEYEYVVKFGKYEQDGSGGEYAAVMCIGFYGEAVSSYKIDRTSIADIQGYGNWDIEVIGNIHEQAEQKGNK